MAMIWKTPPYPWPRRWLRTVRGQRTAGSNHCNGREARPHLDPGDGRVLEQVPLRVLPALKHPHRVLGAQHGGGSHPARAKARHAQHSVSCPGPSATLACSEPLTVQHAERGACLACITFAARGPPWWGLGAASEVLACMWAKLLRSSCRCHHMHVTPRRNGLDPTITLGRMPRTPVGPVGTLLQPGATHPTPPHIPKAAGP